MQKTSQTFLHFIMSLFNVNKKAFLTELVRSGDLYFIKTA